MANRR